MSIPVREFLAVSYDTFCLRAETRNEDANADIDDDSDDESVSDSDTARATC